MALYPIDGTGEIGYTEANNMKTWWMAASAPATPATGEIWYDTANSAVKRFNGATWDTLLSISGAGEASLGTPAVNGMFLTSLTDGTRSWKYATERLAAIVPDTGAINTTETAIVGGNAGMTAIPANKLLAGSNFRILITGTITNSASNAGTIYIHYGAAGTTADTVIASVAFTSANSGTNVLFTLDINLQVRTIGASATFAGVCRVSQSGASGYLNGIYLDQKKLTVANGDTTATSYMTVSYKSAASTTTCTFNTAVVDLDL